MYFIKAEVRLEGSSNRNWKLTFEDGHVEKYYSIEGSAQREGDDAYVFEYDPMLDKLLDGLSCDYHGALDNQILEFTVSFKDGLETCVVTKSEFI